MLLALDTVLGAVNDDYDVAVLFSGDTDLIPAIDATIKLGKRVENAVWWPDYGHGRPLRASGAATIWCHRLKRPQFEFVRDDTDYAYLAADPAGL